LDLSGWKENLDDVRRSDTSLQTLFRKTHASIHRQQRYAFGRDACVAILLFVAATIGMGIHMAPAVSAGLAQLQSAPPHATAAARNAARQAAPVTR